MLGFTNCQNVARAVRWRRTVALAVVGVMLAGCVSATSISRNRLYGRYDVTEVQWGAGGNRDFKVVVRNNPSDMPQEQFDQAVIDGIQNQITFMRTNFTTTPGDSARLQYRIEFFFNPPDSTNGFVLCNREREMPQPVARPGTTYVLGAFCLRDRPLSEAFGSIDNAPPGSPQFNQLMSQLIRSLLPQVRRGRQTAACPSPALCS